MNAKGLAFPLIMLGGSIAGCTLSSPFSDASSVPISSADGVVQPMDERLGAPQSMWGRMLAPFRSPNQPYALDSNQSSVDPTSLSSETLPISADLHYKAGRVYEAKGDIDGALDHYAQAIQVDESHVPVIMAVARLYDRQRDYSNAEKYYLQVIELEPHNAAVWNDLGLCYSKSGQANQALSALNRAAQISPTERRYRNNLATVLVDAGRIDEAHGQLAPVFGEAIAHYNVGYLLSRKGRADLAQRHFQLALASNPNFAEAQNMLISIQSGLTEQAPPERATNLLETLPTGQNRGAGQQSQVRSTNRHLPPIIGNRSL